MKKVLFFSGVIIILLFIGVGTLHKSRKKPDVTENDHLPTIYNLGIEFDDYDPETGMAGDFKFRDVAGIYGSVFLEFGSSWGPPGLDESTFPHPTYILPKNTPVMSVVNGKVTNIRYQEESGDYELVITDPNAPAYKVGYDHIINLKVEKGDKVKAGNVIAQSPGNLTSGMEEWGIVEITVFEDGIRPESIINYCPYMLLDDTVKNVYTQKIIDLANDWESFVNDPKVYDQENWFYPGCVSEKLRESELIDNSV